MKKTPHRVFIRTLLGTPHRELRRRVPMMMMMVIWTRMTKVWRARWQKDGALPPGFFFFHDQFYVENKKLCFAHSLKTLV